MKTTDNSKYDVVVIGAGPAGMMAAARSAERNLKTLLLEKNTKPGKKLLITGGGRCNLTNNKPDLNRLVECFRDKPGALYSAFSRFDVPATISYFQDRGLETKTEAQDRVFPVTDKAESVWNVLLDDITYAGVILKTNTTVRSIKLKKDSGFTILTTAGSFDCKSCIIATGGTSHPETGSTGDAFAWLKQLGHKVVTNDLSLVPLTISDKWVTRLSGVRLDDIRLNLFAGSKKITSVDGKILFTHFGVSGPTVLNISSLVREKLEEDKVTIGIDLRPDLDFGEIKKSLYAILETSARKNLKNAISELVNSSVTAAVLSQADVDGNKKCSEISRAERIAIINTAKNLQIQVTGLMGPDKAIVSSGGVDINEVDFTTMESKIVPGLYIIGDMLNIDRPSGGFSLQICWSTGYLAGINC